MEQVSSDHTYSYQPQPDPPLGASLEEPVAISIHQTEAVGVDQTSEIQWVPTSRGKKSPVVQGYQYRFIRTGPNNQTYWKCANSEKFSCKATLITYPNGQFSFGKTFHTHNFSKVEIERKKFNATLKRKAVESPEVNLEQVYKKAVIDWEQTEDLSPIITARVLGKGYGSYRSSMNRERAKHLPKVPHTFKDISEIKANLFEFEHNNQTKTFLLYNGPLITQLSETSSSNETSSNSTPLPADSSVELTNQTIDGHFCGSSSSSSSSPSSSSSSSSERILVLGVKDSLIYLQNTSKAVDGESSSQPVHIFSDGTFKVAPKPFKQLYTFHAYVGKLVFPIVYALLPDKKTRTYMDLLKIVKEQIMQAWELDWHPSVFHIDFELGMKKAIQEVLPDSQIRGCYFHYSQAIIKRVNDLRLMPNYMVLNSPARKIIRTMTILPLLPLDKIDQAFDLMRTLAINSYDFDTGAYRKMSEFLAYMTRTWVGGPTVIPMYHRSIWTNIIFSKIEQTIEPKTFTEA